MTFVDDIVREAFAVRVEESAADWLRNKFYTQDGRAYSETTVPWVTAPQGPCCAYDNIGVRTIWLQWASRCFKTNFGLAMLMRGMETTPGEFMFATPDEGNCKSVFSRLWKMLENCPPLRDEVPPAGRQNKTAIKIRRSIVHGAWPRGKSRLADKSIRFGHGNEIDKWALESTATEGDPIARFRKRGAEYADRKFVLESTPSIAGRSAVEAGRLESSNHRYHVPCPHCFKFQTLEFGDGRGPGQIHYERLAGGVVDKQLARRTAHFVCLHCEGRIDDIHRPAMMGAGVWVPAGCKVDHDKANRARELAPDDLSWLRGEPINGGADYGSQLSVFYALFHGWGDIVGDFLDKYKKPKLLQQWVNEDKGETWAVRKSRSTPERVAERLKTTIARGALPAWTRLLTVTVDQQEADGGFRLWTLLAHGVDEECHVVDYGLAETLAEIWDNVIRGSFRHLDGGPPLTPHAAGVDSGWDTKNTYDFCNAHPGLLPIKGASTDLDGQAYRVGNVKSGENVGQMLLTVGTDFWETDLQSRLDDKLPGEPGSLSFCSGAETDTEFLEQLCNGVLADKIDRRGNARLLWIRKDENVPNDFRDCVRYGICLARAYTDDYGGYPARVEVAGAGAGVVSAGSGRTDGREWT